MLRKFLILLPLLLIACGLFGGCSVPSVPGLSSYKIDIQQGNVINQDMVAKLQPGMTRSQVRFVLGTPLLVDPFRTDRWDYVYFLDKKGGRVEQRQLRVYFKDDKMERYEGDLAAEAKVGAAAAAKPAAAPVAKPAAAAPAQPVAAPTTPAREAEGDARVKPQLRLAPSEGQPATLEERAAAAVPAPATEPAVPATLEAPPLPRLQLPPETTEPPAAAKTSPDTPAKP